MNKTILRASILTAVLAMALIINMVLAQGTELYRGLSNLGAGLGFGLAACGAGIGVGLAGAAAIGAIVERRELFAMYLLFIALAEAIAIYGFAIAFILMK